MTCGDAIVGDTVAYSEGATVKVKVKNFRRGQKLYVRSASGILFETKCKKSGDYEFEVPVAEPGFVRAETKKVYDPIMAFVLNMALVFMVPQQAFKGHPKGGYCTALCSPIYFE